MKCEHCNAPLNPNLDKCEYCRVYITTGYVLTSRTVTASINSTTANATNKAKVAAVMQALYSLPSHKQKD